MVFSVWPLFVTQVLGANMAILGLIDGLGDAIVSISGAFGGYISDKTKKRKIFVWIGYLFGGISRIGYALSPTWHWIIPFRFLDRSGKIRSAPRDAIIAALSTTKNRGSTFGILRTMDNLGAVVGIIIAITFVQTLGYKNLFFLAAIPSILSVLLIIFFIKEPKNDTKHVFKGIRFKDISRDLKLLTILSGIFALGSFSYSFLLLFANKFGFANYQIPILYLLFTFVAAIVSIPFGKLADKFGRKVVLFSSYFFWIMVLLFIIYFPHIGGIIAAFTFYGLHKGALDTVQRTFVAELAPKEFVASTLGAFQMIIGLVAFPASLFAGFLWDTISPFAPFYFSLGLTVLSAILLLFIKETKK